VSRNNVFVQSGIRAVKLTLMSIGVSLRIDTGVILSGDAMRSSQISVCFSRN